MAPQVAVVTGGNKGIGFAIVKGLCQKFNGDVFLTARDVGRGEAAVAELKKLGLNPKFHQLDICDQKSLDTFRDYIKENYGGLNVLVNNAAIAYKNNATEPFSEQAEKTIAVNYTQLAATCHTLFPLLQPQAKVVNVSSSAGHLCRIPSEELREKFANPSLTEQELNELMQSFVKAAQEGNHTEKGWPNSAYSVSKVGVSALTFVQHREFLKAKKDIIINSVHPGYVDTDMTSHKGPLTPDEGADAPLYLALLPPDASSPRGEYVWRDRQVVNWVKGPLPSQY